MTLRLVFAPLKGDRARVKRAVVLVLSRSRGPQGCVPIGGSGFAVFPCQFAGLPNASFLVPNSKSVRKRGLDQAINHLLWLLEDTQRFVNWSRYELLRYNHCLTVL